MNAARTSRGYVSSGGPNGAVDGYASTVFAEPSSTSAVEIFNGLSNFNASHDAFVGESVSPRIDEDG